MAAPKPNADSLKTQLVRFAVFCVVLAMVWAAQRYGLIEGDDPAPSPVATKPSPTETASQSAPQTKLPAPKSSPSSTGGDVLVIRNVTLRDEDREVIYRGDIDLRPTLERIAAGRKLRFSHDGTTFQNREGRLPQKSSGYYQEWVVSTPGENGPGPQRLVTGADGDVWYTADHYLSFRRVPIKLPAFESTTDR